MVSLLNAAHFVGNNSRVKFDHLVENCINATAVLRLLQLLQPNATINEDLLVTTVKYAGGLTLTMSSALKEMGWNPRSYIKKAYGIQVAQAMALLEWTGRKDVVCTCCQAHVHRAVPLSND